MAAEYLARQHVGLIPCRFDVVAIDHAAARPVITLYRHAFTL
jgi:hypothetical protein